ncbi:MAG: antibiotic biosynthesis monooxygenase [Allobaculum sp.]|nr:antibiotic biosynthesis monooxygenase [Allobaculum sp.]
MSIVVNLYYTGENGSAQRFVQDMIQKGIVDRIRAQEGNLGYEYFLSLDDPETILLIDRWENQDAIDRHHASPMMAEIAQLRDQYDLHMHVERFTNQDELPQKDQDFIRT